jgi:3-oxoadipate enol-lactonase
MSAGSGSVSVEGGRLHYERAGHGFPVVLIHAGLWDARMWDEQFEAFAEHHDVIRYDVRGYGRSDVPTASYSDLRDLRYLLGDLGVTRCALVGCSMGAQIALDFALEFPGMVDGVVPVSPGLSGYVWEDTGLDALFQAVEGAVAEGDLELAMAYELAVWTPGSDEPEVDARIRAIAMDNVHIFRVPDAFAEGPPAPALPRLGELQAATLVVVGEQDLGEIHAIADAIVALVPGAHKDVIAGADHLVNMRKPERFNRIVLDFLSWRT